MKSAVEETNYFYKRCLRPELSTDELKKLIELTLKYSHLSRFAAVLPFESLEELGLSEKNVAKFNAIKMAVIASNLKQQAFIRSLIKELEKHCIPVILLKSSGLNGYLYPNQHCRGNSDIDILIKATDKEKVDKLLNNVSRLHKNTDPQPFEGLYEQTWVSKHDPTLLVDVHTELTNPKLFSICTNAIFSRSMQHPIYNNRLIRIMAPEHNLIHAALHIFGDGYLPHHSLVDATLLCDKESINWQVLHNESKSWGCELITNLLIEELKSKTDASNLPAKRSTAYLKTKLGLYLLGKSYPVKSRKRKIHQAFLQLVLVDNIKRAFTTQALYIRLKLFR